MQIKYFIKHSNITGKPASVMVEITIIISRNVFIVCSEHIYILLH